MAENTTPEGERIAKVLSRRGVASRREAERLIEAGEVKVNGKIIESPALNVTDADKITISGHPLPALEPARLWLYYKPDGLVTSEADEKGRDTVFDHLPDDMPRVMSVGRLDLNSEGLLLLTNDGELKRRLELPSTGWLRKYRVRVNGNPTDPDLEPLRKGVEVDGERFQPMTVILDRLQGANCWLTVGLREGKNREIRRAMNAINLTVNRLIRVSYGPFRLGELRPGEVEEIKQKVLREQLGSGVTDDGTEPAARKPRPTGNAARRVRPGDAVKALAKAWDEATKPAEDAKPRRSVTTTSSRREVEDADPRRTPSKPGRSATPKTRDYDAEAPRRSAPAKPGRAAEAGQSTRRAPSSKARDYEAEAPRRSAPAKPGRSAAESSSARRTSAPKSRDAEETPRWATPAKTGRSAAPKSRDHDGDAPRRSAPAKPTRSRDEGAVDRSKTSRIAGPKSSAPRGASAPKGVAGPRSGGPRKPPSGPKRG